MSQMKEQDRIVTRDRSGKEDDKLDLRYLRIKIRALNILTGLEKRVGDPQQRET